MAKITITIDGNDPTLVSLLGANFIDKLADRKGYTQEVHNPDYVPAVGSPTMDDTSKQPVVEPETGVARYPQIPNPNYVPEVGTPTIQNPETRAEFVGRKALVDRIIPWALEEVAENERRTVNAKIEKIKQAVEKSATIKVV